MALRMTDPMLTQTDTRALPSIREQVEDLMRAKRQAAMAKAKPLARQVFVRRDAGGTIALREHELAALLCIVQLDDTLTLQIAEADPGLVAQHDPDELTRLRRFATETRAILVDDHGYWRTELSGADVIEAVTTTLQQAGLGGVDDEGERLDCHGCGENWQVEDSDADDPNTYCSRACQQRDAAALRSRGESA